MSAQGTSTAVSTVDGWCSRCERHHIPKRASQGFRYTPECPRERPFVLPIMLTGIAGTCVGSRFKGHARRGGKKLRKEHRQHGIVALTNEFRTSKTCLFCFQQVRLAQSRRLQEGRIKVVRVHGSLECVNPACPSVLCGYTQKPRDAHAAVCIALAGASNLLSLNRQTLAPFRRQTHNVITSTTTTINTSTKLENSFMPWTSTTDATGAPRQDLGL